MPLLTPTRALLVLTSFLLVSFLWTWGLPRQYAPSTLPINSHDAPNEKPVGSQLIPEPLVEDAGGREDISQEKEKGDSPSASDVSFEKGCKDVRGADKVMVIVRISKAEMDETLPVHLKTLLSCVPNYLIFSDHHGKIDGFPVHDALDTITTTTKSKHDEFLEYKKIHTDQAYKPNAEKAKALDKWKYLPMVYKTATMAPDHRFYLFIESDTILSWTNLLQWLDRLDYRIPYYIGAPNTIDDKRYAQRGPGILLSYGALRQYHTTYEDRYADEWESQVATACCGDLVLATAMKDSRVEYSSSKALLEAEASATLEWTQKYWCTPIVSWHHLAPKESETFYSSQQEWTQKHGWAMPYVHYNAFEQFVKPKLAEMVEDWDNISSDTQLKTLPDRRDENSGAIESAPHSPSTCQAACQKSADCLQWKHRDDECHLGKALRFGVKSADTQKWVSGWMLERVTKVTDDWGKCERADWRFNQ